jgi:bla regulator protein blaR1
MSALNIPQELIQSIGWTLVHSIWQAFVIYFIMKLVIRLIPTRSSPLRYWVGVGSLVTMLVASIATFLILNGSVIEQPNFQNIAFTFNNTESTHITASLFSQALQWIDANIIWLIRFWMLGFLIGLCRIAAGLWYIDHLRKSSHPVQEEWMQIVSDLSKSLQIRKTVAMAEASISSPMVVGFIKPMILFPIGLLSGLTAEQVETILVHELAHIRRQDYAINLFQAIVETIFFFNPFVLLISSLIREERENCCDDMVIAQGVSPINYVRTLAQLEGARSSSTLALGLAGNQNQLLNRIKRIMENSAKNDWGKGRLVPIALLLLGFVCASWLSIGTEAHAEPGKSDLFYKVVSDTSKDKMKVLRSRNRQSSPKSETVESVSPAEPTEVIVVPGFPDEDFVYSREDFEEQMALVPPFDIDVPEFHFDTFGEFENDSLPGGFRYRSYSAEEWATFEEEFRKKFQEQFKDFYSKNQEQFDKMMTELRKEQSEAAEVVDLSQLRHLSEIDADNMRHLAEKMRELSPEALALQQKYKDGDELAYTFKFRDEESFNLLKQQLKGLEKLADINYGADVMNMDQFNMLQDQIKLQSRMFTDMAAQSEKYTQELQELLVKDGYIKKGEGLGDLHIMDNGGKMMINGTPIKDKDIKKYQELHKKYFEGNFDRSYERKSYGRPE